MRLARRFGGEIVNQDSRQVYRCMDIGTAKPTLAERELAPHHGLDLVAPDETWTLAHQQRLTYDTVRSLAERSRLPILVGGTGQYLRAALEGWTIPEVPPDQRIRERLRLEAETAGVAGLYDRLRRIDPQAAWKIMPNDLRRIVRALEVWETTGRRISEQQRAEPPPYDVLLLGLTLPREALYGRIDDRAARMMRSGLLEEISGLLDRGYDWSLASMQTIGYGEFRPYFEGRAALEECVERLRFNTHRLARHQYVWFRRFENLHWLDAGDSASLSVGEHLVASWLVGH